MAGIDSKDSKVRGRTAMMRKERVGGSEDGTAMASTPRTASGVSNIEMSYDPQAGGLVGGDRGTSARQRFRGEVFTAV